MFVLRSFSLLLLFWWFVSPRSVVSSPAHLLLGLLLLFRSLLICFFFGGGVLGDVGVWISGMKLAFSGDGGAGVEGVGFHLQLWFFFFGTGFCLGDGVVWNGVKWPGVA